MKLAVEHAKSHRKNLLKHITPNLGDFLMKVVLSTHVNERQERKKAFYSQHLSNLNLIN